MRRILASAVSVLLASVSLALAPSASAAASTTSTPAALALPNGAPDISLAEVQTHLSRLATIASSNGGNRCTGRSGYRASVDYVRSVLAATGYAVTEQAFSTNSGISYNLIAELPGADPSRVIMVGGHLDGVCAGPGINDNGTGSAAILTVARTFASLGFRPPVTIRFAWWGAEEQGLLGSRYYVNTLSSAERSRIRAYLNFDMIGSPNPGYFVYNDDSRGAAIRDILVTYFTTIGITPQYTYAGGRSDHGPFISAGIPTGGTFSGAEEIKTAAQAALWGGTAGRAFDPCYHRSCDNLSNVNSAALERHANAISYVLWELLRRSSGASVFETFVNAADYSILDRGRVESPITV